MSEANGNGHGGAVERMANNATFIIMARLSAVFGVPLAAFVGLAVWNDVRELKRDVAAQNTSVAVIQSERVADRQVVNGIELRVGRLEDSVFFKPLRSPSPAPSLSYPDSPRDRPR